MAEVADPAVKAPRTSGARSARARALRLASTAAFGVVLVKLAPIDEWVAAAAGAAVGPLIAALLLVILAGLVETLRLRTLCRLPPDSFVSLLQLTYTASCVAHLPFGLVGSDAYRVGRLSSLGVSRPTSITAVVAARGLGLAATLLITALAGAWATLSTPMDGIRGLPSVTILLLVLSATGLAVIGGLWAARRMAQRPRAPRLLQATMTAVGELDRHRLTTATWLSITIIVLRSTVVASCAWAFVGSPTIPSTLFAAGVGMIAAVIPSVVAGIGPMEAGLASTLTALGVAPAAAVVIALSSRLMTLLGAIVGAIVSALAGWMTR